MQADYTVTIAEERFGNRHYDGIHTRSRAAAAKDNDRIFHIGFNNY
jgi:hypothetical protein